MYMYNVYIYFLYPISDSERCKFSIGIIITGFYLYWYTDIVMFMLQRTVWPHDYCHMVMFAWLCQHISPHMVISAWFYVPASLYPRLCPFVYATCFVHMVMPTWFCQHGHSHILTDTDLVVPAAFVDLIRPTSLCSNCYSHTIMFKWLCLKWLYSTRWVFPEVLTRA
jgi:hypothetical protein